MRKSCIDNTRNDTKFDLHFFIFLLQQTTSAAGLIRPRPRVDYPLDKIKQRINKAKQAGTWDEQFAIDNIVGRLSFTFYYLKKFLARPNYETFQFIMHAIRNQDEARDAEIRSELVLLQSMVYEEPAFYAFIIENSGFLSLESLTRVMKRKLPEHLLNIYPHLDGQILINFCKARVFQQFARGMQWPLCYQATHTLLLQQATDDIQQYRDKRASEPNFSAIFFCHSRGNKLRAADKFLELLKGERCELTTKETSALQQPNSRLGKLFIKYNGLIIPKDEPHSICETRRVP